MQHNDEATSHQNRKLQLKLWAAKFVLQAILCRELMQRGDLVLNYDLTHINPRLTFHYAISVLLILLTPLLHYAIYLFLVHNLKLLQCS